MEHKLNGYGNHGTTSYYNLEQIGHVKSIIARMEVVEKYDSFKISII